MAKNTYDISKEVNLPKNAITQKLGWIGTSGSGKTYGAGVFAEDMYRNGGQFVVLDPVGVWYGLRLEKGGKKPSDISIPVFGGLHGDIPIEPTSGAMLADLVVDKGISAILDVSQFEFDTDKAKFAAAFADRFFFRKKAAPSAVHLFLEECQEFVPQNPQRGEERMLHAFTRLQKIGRNFGIGVSLITQRPQEVSKRVLNLAGTLFVFRTTGSHERKAIELWMQDKSIEGDDLMSELPKLETGAPHLWSPEWLKVSKVVHINKKSTFDASATPEIGAKAVSRELASIDLEKIREDMKATIEKAKGEDPKLLKKEIARLTSELSRKLPPTVVAAPAEKLKIVERPMLKDSQIKKLEGIFERMTKEAERHGGAMALLWKNFNEIGSSMATALEVIAAYNKTPRNTLTNMPPSQVRPPIVVVPPPVRSLPVGTPNMNRTEGGPVFGSPLELLKVLTSYFPEAITRKRAAAIAEISPTKSTFRNAISVLKMRGYIEVQGDDLVATQAGMDALGAVPEPPKSPEEVRDGWLRKLPDGPRSMLEFLIKFHPDVIDRTALAEGLGLDPNVSTFRNYLSTLRTRGLIHTQGNAIGASSTLF